MRGVEYPPHPCPKCNRLLQCSGVLTVTLPDGEFEVPSYQCDECLVMMKFGTGEFEAALTFAVGKDGQPFDPSAEDGRLRF